MIKKYNDTDKILEKTYKVIMSINDQKQMESGYRYLNLMSNEICRRHGYMPHGFISSMVDELRQLFFNRSSNAQIRL